MITSKIQACYTSLTPAQRKVAAEVMERPGEVTGLTVSQLADRCAVAPSAVVRFCRAVGLEGFQHLKLALATELGRGQGSIPMPAAEENGGAESVVRKVFRAGIQTLTDTLNMLDYATIEKMADALAGAKRIFVFGVGTSSVIAADAQYRLSQMGLWATACTDILMMNVTASNLGPGDVVLAISHSGRTKAVVDAVRRAGEGGAVTLAITSFRDSLLHRGSHHTAFVYADDVNYPVEAVSARVAHTCLVDALTMVLATRNIDDYADRIKARNKILDEIRYKER